MRKIPLLKPSSTADRVANILLERILGMAENAYMGSEADIAAEIGVSMPTLRQASRMLEYEELLVVKPGKGGGYFTRRPTIETAIKSASQYLSAKDLISNASFMDAADSVVVPMLIGAVKCEDVALIKKLEAFIVEQKESADNLLPPEESFKYSADFMGLLAAMSGNILIELFVRILWNEVSTSRTKTSYNGSQDLIELNYKTRLGLAEAVISQDAELAIKAWQKRSKFLRTWPRRGLHLLPQRRHS